MNKIQQGAMCILAAALFSSGAPGWVRAESLLTPAAPQRTSVQAAQVGQASPAASADVKPPRKLQPVWQADTAGSERSALLPVSNGLTYYTDRQQTLHAADIRTGKIKWSIKEAGAPEVVTSNTVSFINKAGQLVKADAVSGRIHWKVSAVKLPNVLGAHIHSVGGLLLVLNEDGGVSAYNPSSGKRIWKNSRLRMYASDVIGQYSDTLVVASSVDNMQTRFFGLDPDTGKIRWSLTGFYNKIGTDNGNLVLREVTEQAMRLFYREKPFRGYQFRLALLDPKTGRIVETEKYGLLQDARLSVDLQGYLTGKFAYGVEGELDSRNVDNRLTRYLRGSTSPETIKSYAEYGNLVSGLEEGWFFFQKNGVLTALRASDDKTVSFGRLPASVETTGVKVEGQYVFAGLNGGGGYLFNLKTGAPIGRFDTELDLFTHPFFSEGMLFIRTETKIEAFQIGE
ncbi:PQQ-binding-like beta-propeller repeat protein [Saccharibacillus sp. CPCC 101409]|uniref:outer membrane protein assembly factor BamB family protein n=1 Tax=Saccharibacillus sp. CPCC 101409 TaxID=3058041 RepID=UPI002672B150|nr:PQQ-binding-like beta-propeller repeat protein [Saccharibacillus sp. CPCC 101409]MDO3412248.1 PQQ-binding-like beta-propeller repeat protein [Saccharibacillus sp. CPCC 101409]